MCMPQIEMVWRVSSETVCQREINGRGGTEHMFKVYLLRAANEKGDTAFNDFFSDPS